MEGERDGGRERSMERKREEGKGEFVCSCLCESEKQSKHAMPTHLYMSKCVSPYAYKDRPLFSNLCLK